MTWIARPRPTRVEDVGRLLKEIEDRSPDRFWLSSIQDGPDVQMMRVTLPAGEDIYYDVTITTAQLEAARAAAIVLGQRPGDKLAITPTLLSMLDTINHESFEIDLQHDNGLGAKIVLDEPGLTHEVIDRVLGEFIDNGQLPLVGRPVETNTLIERLINARSNGKQHLYPL